jgi:hypothetical protein
LIVARTSRIPAIAQRFKCCIDLVKSDLGHGGVPAPPCEDYQRDTLTAETRSPVAWPTLADPFLQRLAIGNNAQKPDLLDDLVGAR